MKHKVRVLVETEKEGLFGTRKVLEERTVEVDGRTFRKMKQEQAEKRKEPFTVEEMLFYDEIFGD